LLVDSEKVFVQLMYREDGKEWASEIFTQLDETVTLKNYDVQFTLADIYQDLK
jgi:hypothetical protein